MSERIYPPIEHRSVLSFKIGKVVGIIVLIILSVCVALGVFLVMLNHGVFAMGPNYGEQKTAPIHVLEPKVSDVYYQNTFNPQQAGRNLTAPR